MSTNRRRAEPSETAESPDAAKPPPRMRRAERKRQLLNHAKQLFMALGYQHTTTEKIAAAAGVSEPVLYRHFESKKMLFLEVLQEVRTATLTRWRSETAEPADGDPARAPDPLQKLHAIADMYLGATQAHALELGVLHRTLLETDDEEIVASLREFYLESEAVLAQIIAEGQQAGVFRRSLDPRVGAWELIRTALGYTLTLPLGVPLYGEPDYLPRAIECMLQCLIKTDV